jgi:hypothetical protein
MRSVNRPRRNHHRQGGMSATRGQQGRGLTAWDRAHSPLGVDPQGTAGPGRKCYSQGVIKPA